MPNISKRDHSVEPFAPAKITAAVLKCFASLTDKPRNADKTAARITAAVEKIVARKKLATVEQIQDLVEIQLMNAELYEAARQFILYREEHRKMRDRIDPESAAALRDQKQYFPTELQAFQFMDKYARYNETLGRRETWPEAVDRVMAWFHGHMTERHASVSDDSYLTDAEWAELRAAMLAMNVMPSMRVLQMAGPALDRCNVGVYNCSYIQLDHLRAFPELLYCLMQGTGCGFSVENEFISELPKVKKQQQKQAARDAFAIPDNTEGWCDALLVGLNAWFSGGDIQFDYSHIRPQGSALKTKGGRASGAGPLRELLQFVRARVLNRQGRRLTSLDCHDIACYCGRIVQVGGVRRAAEISLSDLDDLDMRTAKSGNFYEAQPQRSMANNSAVYSEKPTAVAFMEEWLSLAQSGSGERGIFNRGSLPTQIPKRRSKREFGVNPCQPGWATVLTPLGISTIDDVDVGTQIWSGKDWTTITRKVSTGRKRVLSYQTTSGIFVGTENHRVVSNGEKVEAANASSIDIARGPVRGEPEHEPMDVMDGLVLGDGSVHAASGDLVYLIIGKDDQDYFSSEIADLIHDRFDESGWRVTSTIDAGDLPKTFERQIPTRFYEGSMWKVAGFLRGLFSANGSVIANAGGYSGRVTLKASSLDIVIDVQVMLSSLGITSYYTTNTAHSVRFANGVYDCKESYDLNISADRDTFRRAIGFIQPYKNKKLAAICRPNPSRFSHGRDRTSADVRNTVDLGEHDVFDITVDASEHTYWTGGLLVSNCGEIILRDRQFCNLSIAVARSDDTVESLAHKVRLAAIFGTLQSTFTKFNYLSPEWKKNCDEERLLGVDITGQMDCPLLQPPTNGGITRRTLLTALRHVAVDTNVEFAKRLSIPASTAVTCVKPSGNSSVLFDCSSGLHPRHAPFYIRRVVVGSDGPMAQLLKSEGVPYEPSYSKEGNLVFEFPCKSAPGAIVKADLSAWAQLENWYDLKRCYTEHNPSATIYVAADEWIEVGHWVYEHWETVGGLSFLPRTDTVYAQAPYEEITADEYARRQAAMPSVDYAKLLYYEHEDTTTVAQDFACVAGVCEI